MSNGTPSPRPDSPMQPNEDGYDHIDYEAVLDTMEEIIPTLQEFNLVMKQMKQYVIDGANHQSKTKIVDSIISHKERVDRIKLKAATIQRLTEETDTIQKEIVEKHKENIEKELNKLQQSLEPGQRVTSWADEPFEEPVQSWKTVVAHGRKNQTAVPSTRKFSVSSVMEGSTKWVTMHLPITEVNIAPPTEESPFTASLITVSSDAQLAKLPAGMMVYHAGLNVPKVVMTTGKPRGGTAVPTGCMLWDYHDSDTIAKFSRYNSQIPSEKRPHESNFYIDESNARKLRLDEDTYRVFRMPNNKSQWLGYRVFKCNTFGDSRYLSEQFAEHPIEDTIDLYQYALWMSLVGMLHYQCS